MANIEKRQLLQLHNPGEIMSFGNELKGYIEKNGLSVSIQGKNYPMVDAWKFAGMNFGISAIPTQPKALHQPGQMLRIGFGFYSFKDRYGNWREAEKPGFVGFADDQKTFELWKGNTQKFSRELIKPYYAYECQAEALRFTDGIRVGAGDGFCENLEMTKVAFDQYAVRSMAQTRAIGKALRNLLGFVMNSAGYEPTPAEEMTEVYAEEQQEKDDRLIMPDDVFKKAISKLNKGQTTLEKIEAAYKLTPDQKATLETIEKTKSNPK